MSEQVVYINNPKRIVPGIGPATAKIMLVGEAPGAQEERIGRPFVGQSGMLLDQMLNRAGIIRGDCYLTNVVKERPQNNNIKPYLDLAKKVPRTGESYPRYREHLKEEIRNIEPNVVIAVGAVPLWTLCQKKGINKWRGSVLESTLVPGVKVIPTIHPAAALRQYVLRHLILFDLRRARFHSESPELPKDNNDYILRPSFEACIDFLRSCHGPEHVGFDIEVGSGEVSCISFAVGARSISIPFVDNGKDYFPPPQEVEIWKAIATLLEDESTPKIAHNASFDVTFIYRKYGIQTRNLHDTMIAQAIINPDFSKSLAMVTSLYTNIPYYKDEGKEGIEAGNKALRTAGSQENFWLYNAKDSAVLVEAFPKLMRDLENQGNVGTYDRQRALIDPFLFLTERGILMDRDGLVAEAEYSETRIEQLTKALHGLVGFDINPNSPKQLIDWFYGTMKVKAYRSRVSSKPTVDVNALKRLVKHDKEEVAYAAQIVQKIRKLTKLKGTYLDINLDTDGRLRCSINIVGTKYGRVSSSQTIFGTGTNMQNLPPIMKRFMLPDEGYVAYEVDLAQAENRVVAYISGELNMIEAFESGRDIHSQTAGLIFQKPYSKVSREKGSSTLGSGDLSERDWGKKANHGLNYGMASGKAALLWEVKQGDASSVIERYHSAYPSVRRWHAQIEAQLKKNRTLQNLYGRKVRFLDRLDNNLYMAGYSFIPQSTVADTINERGVKELYYKQDQYQQVELLLQVHDSVLFQIPIDAGWEYHAAVLLSLKESLETPLEYNGREFVLPAEATILPINMKDGKEVDLTDTDPWALALLLKETYTAILDGEKAK